MCVIVTDSYIQPARGEVGCGAEERAAETEAACKILGNRFSVARLGVRDDEATEESIVAALKAAFEIEGIPCSSMRGLDAVYAPALQGGNPVHDMVSRAAHRVFPGNVIEYCTYTKTELYTTGSIEIVPTPEELELKNRALDCYVSQLRINRPHFDAVRGKSEWLIDKRGTGPCPVGHDGTMGEVGIGTLLT